MSDEKPTERYLAAAHAIQTGVALDLESGDSSGSPKQLRTGINLRACDQAGLVRLLIAKGVFTETEYLDAIAGAAEAEKARYEERISKRLGRKVTLG